MTAEREVHGYFAAPLFSGAEKKFNEDLASELESLGLKVFLPQRDGMELAAKRDLPPEQVSRRIFDLDSQRVEDSDVIIAVLDGRVPDEGVCVELAIAHTHRKLTGKNRFILGLKTDTRSLLPNASLNPMIEGLLDHIFEDRSQLIDFVRNNLAKF